MNGNGTGGARENRAIQQAGGDRMKTASELNTGLEVEGLQGQVLLFARLLLAPLFVYSWMERSSHSA